MGRAPGQLCVRRCASLLTPTAFTRTGVGASLPGSLCPCLWPSQDMDGRCKAKSISQGPRLYPPGHSDPETRGGGAVSRSLSSLTSLPSGSHVNAPGPRQSQQRELGRLCYGNGNSAEHPGVSGQHSEAGEEPGRASYVCLITRILSKYICRRRTGTYFLTL